MKTLITKTIDGHTVVRGVDRPTIDPAKTRRYLERHGIKPTRENIRAHAVYCTPHKGEIMVEDAEAEEFKTLLRQTHEERRAGGKRKAVLRDKTVIDDLREETVVHKNGNKFVETVVKKLGETTPKGATLKSELSNDERRELEDQHEENRIAALSNEEREAELEQELDNLAETAATLEKRAEIRGKEFDAKAYFNEKEQELRKRYE